MNAHPQRRILFDCWQQKSPATATITAISIHLLLVRRRRCCPDFQGRITRRERWAAKFRSRIRMHRSSYASSGCSHQSLQYPSSFLWLIVTLAYVPISELKVSGQVALVDRCPNLRHDLSFLLGQSVGRRRRMITVGSRRS